MKETCREVAVQASMELTEVSGEVSMELTVSEASEGAVGEDDEGGVVGEGGAVGPNHGIFLE